MVGLRFGIYTFVVDAPGFVPQQGEGMVRTATMSPIVFTLEREPGLIPGALPSNIQAQIADLESRSLTVSPYIETSITQQANLPHARRVNLSAYILAGAISALCLASLFVLLSNWKNRRA